MVRYGMEDDATKAYIFGAVLILSNRLQVLGDAFDPAVTMKQWMLIAAIYKSGCTDPTVSDIAARTGTSRQNVKKMALILERSGFITLSKDERDGRVVRLSTTKKCDRHFHDRHASEERFIGALFDGIDPASMAALEDGLRRLAGNVAALEQGGGIVHG